MQWLREFLLKLGDLTALIQWAGYGGVTAIVFIETGLLVGFFLPGDSLLVTAGILASQDYLNVWVLGALCSAAGILGDQVGYVIGRRAGPKIFAREDSRFFRKAHARRAHEFYERHGVKTIIIARFVPIVRTFAPVVAGVGEMKYSTFVTYNIVGGLAWVWSMLLTGYYLGRLVPGIDRHLEKVILVVIFLSILPGIYEWWRARNSTRTT